MVAASPAWHMNCTARARIVAKCVDNELGQHQKAWLSVIKVMRGRLRRRAGHADRDSFIGLHHSQRLFAAYAGDKNLVTFGGDHNSHRAPFFYSSAVIFLHAALQCRTPLPRGEPLVDPAAHLRTCAASRALSCQRIAMRVEPAPSCARLRVNRPPSWRLSRVRGSTPQGMRSPASAAARPAVRLRVRAACSGSRWMAAVRAAVSSLLTSCAPPAPLAGAMSWARRTSWRRARGCSASSARPGCAAASGPAARRILRRPGSPRWRAGEPFGLEPHSCLTPWFVQNNKPHLKTKQVP